MFSSAFVSFLELLVCLSLPATSLPCLPACLSLVLLLAQLFCMLVSLSFCVFCCCSASSTLSHFGASLLWHLALRHALRLSTQCSLLLVHRTWPGADMYTATGVQLRASSSDGRVFPSLGRFVFQSLRSSTALALCLPWSSAASRPFLAISRWRAAHSTRCFLALSPSALVLGASEPGPRPFGSASSAWSLRSAPLGSPHSARPPRIGLLGLASSPRPPID